MKRGFTLLEILIVVFIIAVIAAISIPNIRSISYQKNVAKAKAELRALQVALDSYYLYHNSSYPAALADLTSAVPTIVRSIASDPFSAAQASYGYNRSSNAKYYVVYSAGYGGNGSAAVNDSGVLTETNGSSCIYVSNIQEDTAP